jgi:uncharacterized protein YutE (UPF0331/DUF86 family)
LPAEPRKIGRRRWRRDIVGHLEDFPRQYSSTGRERAAGRVQNVVADLAQAGVKLADLPYMSDLHAPPPHRAFAALREAKVIDGELCRRLTRAQDARTMIEHSYVRTPAGNVHQAVTLVHESARDFIGRYRKWVEPYLTEDGQQ